MSKKSKKLDIEMHIIKQDNHPDNANSHPDEGLVVFKDTTVHIIKQDDHPKIDAEPSVYDTLPVSSLTIDPDNANSHPDENLEAIKFSLKEYGQQKPIVVTRDGLVVAGNGTLMAAKDLGWSTIEVRYTDLNGSKRKQFAIADNQSGKLALWNMPVLGQQLKEMADEGFDIGNFKFDIGNFGIDLLNKPEEFTPDLPPENEGEKTKKFVLTVECESMLDLDDLFEELTQRGFKVKA